MIKHSSTVVFLFLNILQNKRGWVINKLAIRSALTLTYDTFGHKLALSKEKFQYFFSFKIWLFSYISVQNF